MHTKGPWSADLTAIINAARGIQAHYQGEAWKDKLDEWNTITQANACLIAAAPEQNSALIDLVTLVKRIIPDADMLHEVRNADEAIRKAKGE
jgi:hypothetical protein